MIKLGWNECNMKSYEYRTDTSSSHIMVYIQNQISCLAYDEYQNFCDFSVKE